MFARKAGQSGMQKMVKTEKKETEQQLGTRAWRTMGMLEQKAFHTLCPCERGIRNRKKSTKRVLM